MEPENGRWDLKTEKVTNSRERSREDAKRIPGGGGAKRGARGVLVGRAPVTCSGFHHSLGEAGRVCSHLWIFNVFNFAIKFLFCMNFICPIIPSVVDIFTL